MKKLMALFLTIMLLISGAAAESMVEESANLTYEELEIYLAQLGKAALESKETVVSTNEEGLATAAFPGGVLGISDEVLKETTVVLSAVLNQDQPCPRGLKIGDSVEALLAAYPNDNASLAGTYYDAALYVAGDKPEMTAGWLLRDGQRITEVVHNVYAWQADGVIVCGVRYQVELGVITGIEVFGMSDLTEESEAMIQIDEVASMQEIQEYFMHPKSEIGSELAIFSREDLVFADMDFLDLTAEMATEALGSAQVDQWTEDSTGEYLRLKQWEDISILFVYDANKQFVRVDSLTINGENVEGPRGVRVDDLMEDVMYRFRHGEGGSLENGVALYGDGKNAPYGVINYGDETVTITYTLALDDDQTVIWHLTFVENMLQSMNMLLR